ncbi:hypothetical protein DPMN_149597 [Dreissena polymorpha]|uniref:Uncharacterized protein n=2 Tax=Dreissena polymorpha TaxID=45954 RepID=A0A9D4FEP9_DREPO|nr:hypothetical protein DPMN_149597 [Dreissena polymorpha]
MQVHRDGKRKIATMSLEADGFKAPLSVFYNMKSASVVVGLGSSPSIVVLKVT